MFVGRARLVTCVTFVLTGPLSLSNALRQRCYPQECIRTAKTIDERTVVRRTNTNNMQGRQILHWELSSAGLIKAYTFTVSERFESLSCRNILHNYEWVVKANSQVLTCTTAEFITAIWALPVSITTLVGWDTLSIVACPPTTWRICRRGRGFSPM